MKHFLSALLIILCSLIAYSQNNGIGVGTIAPHASAALEVKDSARGFLPPRMTYAQRNAISNPAVGLIVFCTDCGRNGGEPQYYNGTTWLNMVGGTAQLGPFTMFPVTIGTQIWQANNLGVSTYRDGYPIPKVTDPGDWYTRTTGAWCWYNNDSTTYAATYGKLYNWYAIEDIRGLCPVGWHVPSDAEWTILENYLGGSAVAGGALKSTTTWNSPNTGATNSSGFSAFAGSYRQNVSYFGFLGEEALFWSSSESSYDSAYYRSLSYNDSTVFRGGLDKRGGLSVRCVKD